MLTVYNVINYKKNEGLKISSSDDIRTAKAVVAMMFRDICKESRLLKNSIEWKNILEWDYLREEIEIIGVTIKTYNKDKKLNGEYYITFTETEVCFPYSNPISIYPIYFSDFSEKEQSELTKDNYWRVVEYSEMEVFIDNDLDTQLLFSSDYRNNC